MLEPLYAPDTTKAQAKAAGWTRVGELEDGTPIWEETRTVVQGKKPLVIGGAQQYVKANGEIVKERTVNVTGTVTRRFTEIKQPNGGKFKNFNYLPDPDEQKRIDRRKKIAEAKDQLAEALVDNGLSVDALVNAIKKPARKAEA